MILQDPGRITRTYLPVALGLLLLSVEAATHCACAQTPGLITVEPPANTAPVRPAPSSAVPPAPADPNQPGAPSSSSPPPPSTANPAASSSARPETPSLALPDAPGEPPSPVVKVAEQSFTTTGDLPAGRLPSRLPPSWMLDPNPGPYRRLMIHRARLLTPYQRFLDTDIRIPLRPSDKAFAAATDVIDPGNLITLVGGSAYFVATTPESAYGPGLKGFGRNVGYSLSQDVTGEFLGTFLIPSIAHQDPRYFRMPGAPLRRRILHALSHTLIASSDDGRPIPNYATLLTYPLTAAISNAYVPGLRTNVRSTAARVAVGLASDPAGALIGEFLPDVAKHIQIRVLFLQQIINNVASQPGAF